MLPQGVGLGPEDVAARERPCWRHGCCWETGQTGRPLSQERRAAAKPEPKNEKKNERNKELRINGARAVPRPRDEVKDVKANDASEREIREGRCKPKLERLPSAKDSNSKDPVSCRESKEFKSRPVTVRRRRSLSGDPRKAHRAEEAKAHPQELLLVP